MKRNSVFMRTMIAVLCLIFVSGCAGLRRKFVRQKKTAKSDRIAPILEPIEYQARYKTPLERYKKAYGLWKVWDNELVQMLEYGGSEKRVKYVLEQMIAHGETMGQVLREEKRMMMQDRLEELYSLLKEFSKPKQFQNDIRIASEVRRHGRLMRKELHPDKILTFLIEPESI